MAKSSYVRKDLFLGLFLEIAERLPIRAASRRVKKMLQTDLYSFNYKKGSITPFCKRCSAENFYRDGKNCQRKQLYRCKNCKFRFVWSSDLPNRRFFSNVISFVVDLYSTVGISLRTLSAKLLKFFDIRISHEGIRQWILTSKKQHFVDDKVDNSQTWNVDETYIKIKGKGRWLWLVYCKETKQVLAWHISKSRFYKDARRVLQKAKQRAGNRPQTIITDGLYQYDAAIKKVTGWHWRTYKKNRLKDSGMGKNSPIERVNKELKRRIKWFGSFQRLKGAKTFTNLFFHYYNKRTSLAHNTD